MRFKKIILKARLRDLSIIVLIGAELNPSYLPVACFLYFLSSVSLIPEYQVNSKSEQNGHEENDYDHKRHPVFDTRM